MPIVTIEIEINADIEICFDLSRSIDFHSFSTSKTRERAISGKTQGLIGMNEVVTWEATHFGIRQKLTSKVTAFKRPFHFRDEQVKGAFKCFVDNHYFEAKGNKTLIREQFEFEAPLGLLGALFSRLVLEKYMKNFLLSRNMIIKDYAESAKWKEFINL